MVVVPLPTDGSNIEIGCHEINSITSPLNLGSANDIVLKFVAVKSASANLTPLTNTSILPTV